MKKQAAQEASHWKPALISSAAVLIAAMAYAVIRYNIIKGVPWEHLPLYISNKGIALASVVLIALAYVFGPLTRIRPKVFAKFIPMEKYFGLLGFGLAAVHGIISLLLFSPANYPKFFLEAGKLNLTGELSMLFGVLGFIIFSLVAISDIPGVIDSAERWKLVQRLGYLAYLFVLLHVAVMGFSGWLQPDTWPGNLLPISLVAFIVIALTFLLRVSVMLFPARR
ncbi:ferric reductase-like transmembrane domain-containing protein [Candidatus Woesearchaeota archaeon]|nr:ferric reductase-like transmembrane domain-containing protein [Candidatus Woesearchaeota archaeon]